MGDAPPGPGARAGGTPALHLPFPSPAPLFVAH